MENLKDYIENAINLGLTQLNLKGEEVIIKDGEWRLEWGDFGEDFYEDINMDDRVTIWIGGEGQVYSICNLIMSRKFIESIMRDERYKEGKKPIVDLGETYSLVRFCYKQADAIREGKIEDFIKNLFI